MNLFLILIGLGGLVGGIVLFALTKGKKNSPYPRVAGIVSLLSVALFIVGNSFNIIPTGKVGVVYQLGVIQEQQGIVSAGTAYWHAPFVQSVRQISVMQENANEASAIDDKFWGESSSKLPVYCRDVRITYQNNSDGIMYLLKNVADMSELSTWGKTVSSAFAASTIQFTDEDVCKQALIEPVMLKELQRLTDAKYGKTASGESNVTVIRVLIGELDYEPDYQYAITERKNAEQTKITAEIQNQQAIAKATADAQAGIIEADGRNQQAINKATADAQAAVIAAQGEAEARLIAAEAEAEQNRMLDASLSELTLARNWIVKWNGQMPYVTDSAGNIIDIAGLVQTP